MIFIWISTIICLTVSRTQFRFQNSRQYRERFGKIRDFENLASRRKNTRFLMVKKKSVRSEDAPWILRELLQRPCDYYAARDRNQSPLYSLDIKKGPSYGRSKCLLLFSTCFLCDTRANWSNYRHKENVIICCDNEHELSPNSFVKQSRRC